MLPQAQTLAGLRLLVVEDEADNRDLLVFLFNSLGASVTAVASAQEALVTLEQFRPDLILCDIGLPDKTGCELLQAWREREIDLGLFPMPAVAVTAYATEPEQQMILDSGFQRCIVKPYDIDELPQVIANLMEFIRVGREECRQANEQF